MPAHTEAYPAHAAARVWKPAAGGAAADPRRTGQIGYSPQPLRVLTHPCNVSDDIITFGRLERRSRRDADEAIESLFDTHYPRMVYTAFSLVGDSDPAEQLAQEAYLRFWRRWRWISHPQAAPMYLQRTVVNLARESIRRRMIERRVLKARSMERPPATEPDAAPVLELRRAIAGLPKRKRECVVLRHLLGLSESETAELLGVSVQRPGAR